jgi:hypothetical protein
MSDVVNKLWGFCHTLRHEGIDYGDYIEQLTDLLFLKMADEREVHLSDKYNWESLKGFSGGDLMDHYTDTLRQLSKEEGLLGEIFSQSQNRFNNPVSLKRLINLIDEDEWTAMDVDVKGAAFEGLLEKSASEGKKGAGQYFTPRPLIYSIVKLMKPDPRGNASFVISDPACGTGGFLVTASSNGFNQIIEKELDKLMTRTSNRPLPSGRMSLMDAYIISIIFGIVGLGILFLYLGTYCFLLGLFALLSYTLIYTPLKKVTPFAVFVGAFPGAIPPLLGYVAATGKFDIFSFFQDGTNTYGVTNGQNY